MIPSFEKEMKEKGLEKWMIQSQCKHSGIVIVVYSKMSNGNKWIYEACIWCDKRLGLNLPIVSDSDVRVASYKYPGKTLGEIMALDKEYVIWIVAYSKASDRIKKAAQRLLQGNPYVVPKEGEKYLTTKMYGDPLPSSKINS